MAMPKISSPCGRYLLFSSTSQGISILHGPHHVAQKFTSTALPRKSASFTVFPSRLSSAKAGAGLPSIAIAEASIAEASMAPPCAAGGLAIREAKNSDAATAATTMIRIITLRFMRPLCATFVSFVVSFLRNSLKLAACAQNLLSQEFLCHRSKKRDAIHPGIDQRKVPREHQRPNGDQQNSAQYFDGVQMPSEAPIKFQKPVNADRSQQKRYGQPQRIYRQQRHAFGHRGLRGRKGQNHAQDRSNPRRPSEGKCKSHQESSYRGGVRFHSVQPLVGIERFDRQYT